MCGISGLVLREGSRVDPEVVKRMSHQMRMRGPDAEGIDIQNQVALIHRRLKIIDLSDQANQPFLASDSRVRVVFNGEIYNYQDLRSQLEKKGHVFRTESDTEVIGEAFLEWGSACFRHFNGMFAIGILDLRLGKPRLYLVRDRFGIKPLFYSQVAGQLAFASGVRSLLEVPWISQEIHSQALFHYLQFSHVPYPDSIFTAIRQVPPAQFFEFFDGKGEFHSYWHPNEMLAQGTTQKRSDQEWVEEFQDIFKRVLKRQWIADVPVGCFLSGGIDSSLIAKVSQEIQPEGLQSFSVGYDEKEFDETPYAKLVAESLGIQNHCLIMNESDVLSLMEQIPVFLDQPLADPTVLSSLLLSKFARNHVTVALSGDGGDELFFGYSYQRILRQMLKWRKVPSSLRIQAFQGVERLLKLVSQESLGRFVHPGLKMSQIFQYPNEAELFQSFIGMVGPLKPQEVRSLIIDSSIKTEPPLFETLLASFPPMSSEDKIAQVFLRTFLTDTVLAKSDRTSMAYGLEVRVPFLDNEIVNFSSRVPFYLKFRWGQSKVLLRQSLGNSVPYSISYRKKQGFSIPLKHWLRGGMKKILLEFLDPNRLKKEGILDPLKVQSLVQEHLNGQANHSHLLWSLLCFEIWKEKTLQ